MTRRATLALLAALALAACGGEEGPEFPTRDWGGYYQSVMTGSSTDCHGAELPPPLTGFTLTVTQHPNNRAELLVPPFIRLRGTFDGDSLVATHAATAPIALPDSIARRASPADSLETIAYVMRLGFREGGYEGTYVIRTPDLNALARGERPGRCTYRYGLRGTFAPDVPTLPAPEAPVSPPADGE